jgi:hypothetical protein
MVVFVLPAPQFGGELGRGAECCPSVELFPVCAVAAFDFAVDLGAAWRDVPMGDAKVSQMPSEVGPELVAVVCLHPLGRQSISADFPAIQCASRMRRLGRCDAGATKKEPRDPG